MKHLEDLTRIHVNDAIRTGLKSQSAHRAVAGQTEPAPPPRSASPSQENIQPSGWVSRIRVIYHHILNPGE